MQLVYGISRWTNASRRFIMRKWTTPISKLGACEYAVEWAGQYKTPKEAWANCEDGSWMLWLLGKLAGEPGSDSRRPLVLATCECARLALPYVKKGDKRPLKAIEVAEQWAKGEGNITLEDVRAAAFSAASYAFSAAAAFSAAYAAFSAASYAAYAASYAAAASQRDVLKQCADIVRKHYPVPPTLPR